MTRWTLVLGVVMWSVWSVGSLAGGRSSCFYRSESVRGQNKICFYQCVTGDAAITIRATQICPLRIDR